MMVVVFHFLTLLKFFLATFVQICMVSQHVLKCTLCIILVLVLYILYKYPRQRFRKLSNLRNYKVNLLMKYKMTFFHEHFYNVFLLLVLASFMVGFIFVLRYSNQEHSLDLVQEYYHVINIIKNSSLVVVCLNFTLFFLVFILYICILFKVGKYLKFHAIKRHLWLMNNLICKDWYEHTFSTFVYRINLCVLPAHFDSFVYSFYKTHYYDKRVSKKNLPLNYTKLSFNERLIYDKRWPFSPFYFTELLKIHRIGNFVFSYGHYVFLLCLILYDLFFNNFVITLVFYALPWTFLYDMYYRLNKFFEDFHLAYDSVIADVLYANSLEPWNEKYILINGDFYDLKELKRIYKVYVRKNFVKDPTDVF